MDIAIHKLNVDRIDDYLKFFEERAFSDNPNWAGCYCVYSHCERETWSKRYVTQNRNDSIDWIKKGILNGYLAYGNNGVVGWMGVDLRTNYASLNYRVNREDQVHPIASIVCITVDPEFRHQGIATQLLNHAEKQLKTEGVDIIEAYPYVDSESPAHNHKGPFSMYKKAGFKIYEEDGETAVVRKSL